ncbi:MAG TPA: hypothetical protein VLV83_04800 [Acidobacteriota bacterium]|nr:hypothetical protein [Acidobacteriota bacterium]
MVDGLSPIERTNEELYDSRYVRRKPPNRRPADHSRQDSTEEDEAQDAFAPEEHSLDVRA